VTLGLVSFIIHEGLTASSFCTRTVIHSPPSQPLSLYRDSYSKALTLPSVSWGRTREEVRDQKKL